MRLSLKPIYYKITFGNKSKNPSFSKQKVLIWNITSLSGEDVDVDVDIIPCACENSCHCCTHYIKTEKTINIHHYYSLDLSHIIVGEKKISHRPFGNTTQIFVTVDCSNCVPYSVDISSIAQQYEIKGAEESSPRLHLHHPQPHPYYPPHHYYPHHYPYPLHYPFPPPPYHPYPPFPMHYPTTSQYPYTRPPSPSPPPPPYNTHYPYTKENIVLPFMENEAKKQIIIMEDCSYNEMMVGVSPENVAMMGEISSGGGDLDDFSMETEPAKEMPNGRPAFSSRILKRRTVPIHMGDGEMDNNNIN